MLCLALPLGQVSNVAFVVVLALVRQSFSLSYSELGFVLASFGVARVLADLPAGALVQRLNPRTALLAALGGILLAAVLGLTATSAWQLGAARFTHGVTSAVFQCAILAWLVGGTETGVRGRVMALSEAVFSFISLAIPVLAGALASAMSWHAAFALGGLTGLLALGGCFLLTNSASAKAALSSPSASAEPARFSQRWRELSTGGPVLLTAYLITFIIFFGRQAGLNTLLPLVGAERVGLSSLQVGLGVALVNGMSIGIVLIGGVAGDRYGRGRLVAAGIGTLLVCQLSILLITSEATFLLVSAFMGLGFFMNSLPLSLIGDALPPERRADGVAVFRLVADVGVLLGPVVTGLTLDTAGFVIAVLVAPGLSLLVLIVVFGLNGQLPGVRAAVGSAASLGLPK